MYNISDVQHNGCTTGVQLKYNVNKYNTIILIRIKDFRHYRVFVLFSKSTHSLFMTKKILYKESFDPNTGNIHLLTTCPYGTGIRVASGECWRCKYFIALYLSGSVECANPSQKSKKDAQPQLFK